MGVASRSQPVLTRSSASGYSDQLSTLQPTPLLSRRLSPSHPGGETELHCHCETEQKDAGSFTHK